MQLKYLSKKNVYQLSGHNSTGSDYYIYRCRYKLPFFPNFGD